MPNVQPKHHKLTNAIALDCEMVGVIRMGMNGNMVARVSLVNANGECIYDTFVKPTKPVADYRTNVSGVRPCDLQYGDEFAEVKNVVGTMLKGRILVGHAVDKDLRVLGCSHPEWNIRDTTNWNVFQRVSRYGTPSLKLLARRFLRMEIQNGAHDSVIDARTAMSLYQLVAADWEASLQSSESEESESDNGNNHYYDSDSSSD